MKLRLLPLFVLAAGCSSSNQIFSVGNQLIERQVSVQDGKLKTIAIVDRATGKMLEIDPASAEFSFVLGEKSYSAADFSVVKTSTQSPPSDDTTAAPLSELIVELSHVDGYGVVVRYTAEKDKPYSYKSLTLTAPSSKNTDRLTALSVEDLRVAKTITEQPKLSRAITTTRQADPIWRYRGGTGLGQPLYLDNWMFAGLQYPLGANELSTNGRLTLQHAPGLTIAAFKSGRYTSQTAVIGVSGKHSVTEAFASYLLAKMRPAKRMRHFIDAFHLRGRANIGVGINKAPTPAELEKMFNEDPQLEQFVRTEKNAIAYASATRAFSEKYKIALDSFTIDGGWQNAQSVFEIDNYLLPGGFAPIQQAAGVPLGLWNSLAGFRLDLPHLNQQKGYPICPPYSWYFDLSQPAYHDAIKARFKALGEQYHVAYWKQDFNYVVCPIETALHGIEDDQSMEANTDVLLDIIAMQHQINPNIVISQTTLIWPSPWWLFHVDAVPGISGDYGYFRRTPAFYPRDWHATWVDATMYRWLKLDGAQFPTSRFMTHGIIQDQYVPIGGLNEPLLPWANGVLAHLAPGLALQELYVDPALLTQEQSQFLAGVFRWMDAEQALLTRYGVMFGGNPQEGLPYGYHHHKDGVEIVIVRNPSAKVQSISVAPQLKNRAVDVLTIYPVIMRQRYDATPASIDVTLRPYEVRVLRLQSPGQADAIEASKDNQPPIVYGALQNESGALTFHKLDAAPALTTVTATSSLNEAQTQLTVDAKAGAQTFVHILVNNQSLPDTAILLDGNAIPTPVPSSRGPCGPYGCPLAFIDSFAAYQIAIPQGQHTVTWQLPAEAKIHAIWVETVQINSYQAVSTPTNMFNDIPLLPTPTFFEQRNWALVFFEHRRAEVKAKQLTAPLKGTLQLDLLDTQIPLGQGLNFKVDVKKQTGHPVDIPITIDPQKGTIFIQGSRGTIAGSNKYGVVTIPDINALGTVVLTLQDYSGVYEAKNGSISVPVRLKMEAPIFKINLDIDIVAVTGVSTVSHNDATATAEGQVLAEDNSVKLAGTMVVPKGVPLAGDLPVAIVLHGKVTN